MNSTETKKWAEAGNKFEVNGERVTTLLRNRARYALLPDCGKKTYLARQILTLLRLEPEAILWVTGWGVWPSSENPELFYKYRRSLGESRSLAEVPAHLCSHADIKDIECLLDICLFFLWDCWLIEHSKELAVFLSHDEFIQVYASDESRLAEFSDLLMRSGLSRTIDS